MSNESDISQLLGVVCPCCGAVNESKIIRTYLSTRIGDSLFPNTQGLVKRSHECKTCGYTGRGAGETPFNTIAIREDHLFQLVSITNSLLKLHLNSLDEISEFPLIDYVSKAA